MYNRWTTPEDNIMTQHDHFWQDKDNFVNYSSKQSAAQTAQSPCFMEHSLFDITVV